MCTYVMANSVLVILVISVVLLSQCKARQCIFVILPPNQQLQDSTVDPCPTVQGNGSIAAFQMIFVPSKTEYEVLLRVFNRSYIRYPASKTRRNDSKFCEDNIGVIGDIDRNTANILHTLASRSNFNLTLVAAIAPSSFVPVTGLSLPNLLVMKPLSHYIEAIVSFVDQWNWTRIGLISDDSLYYQYAAELLLEKLKENNHTEVTPILTVNNNSSIVRSIKTVKEYNTYIIVVTMKQDHACLVLEEAEKENMVWRKYAWIVLSERSEAKTLVCKDSLQGVFLLNIDETESIYLDDPGALIPEFQQLPRSLYPTLHDSVSAVNMSFKLERTNSLTYPGLTGLVEFQNGKRVYNIGIVQAFSNTTAIYVAYYDPKSQLVPLHDILATGDSPQGSTLIVTYTTSVGTVATSMLAYIISIIFVTAVLILYLHFRTEPEVKATSITVSLGMFIGCYLMLSFVPLLLIESNPDSILGQPGNDIVCNFLIWLSGLGLPIILILDALFIKMIRVYVIFMNPHSYKKKLCSNSFLFLYMFLILLPHLLILTFWSATDTFRNVRIESPQTSHLLVAEACMSDHTIIWLCLLLIYIVAVAMALVILAFKSSAIRYKNFNDTKATNAFTFLVIFIEFLGLGYWYFYRNLEPLYTHITENIIVLFCAHFTLPILCQLFLFVPKVYPPLKRCLLRNVVKRK